MTTVGVICEYNPFHNGHLRQFSLIRERFGADTAVVCLMSGNYVQRGAPAVFDKQTRARAAALCGADLVLELPLTYALRSAEGFAAGGVEILTKLGVDALCFGCESGDLEKIMSTARLLLLPELDGRLLAHLQTGVSYASARQAALRELGGMAPDRPNDILAVEYCKAILRQNSALRCFAVRREGEYHGDELNGQAPSAEAIRAVIDEPEKWRASVPEELISLYEAAPRYSLWAGERAVLARVRTLPDEAFAALPYGAEGLWRRFMRACRTEASVDAILNAAKSKRYASTRIRRMLLCAYLGLTGDDLAREAPHVRVLAFNPRGRALLRAFRGTQNRPLSLIDSGETPPDAAYYALECRAADLYALFGEDARLPAPGGEQAARNCRCPDRPERSQ